VIYLLTVKRISLSAIDFNISTQPNLSYHSEATVRASSLFGRSKGPEAVCSQDDVPYKSP
jgi:hypothetical protein